MTAKLLRKRRNAKFFKQGILKPCINVLRTFIHGFMDLLKAISLSLSELEEPVITHYRLGLILHELYAHRRYQKEKLAIKNEQATFVELNTQVANLVNTGVLKPHPNFNGTVYQILGRKADNVE